MGTACLEPALGAGLVFFVAYFVITALAGGVIDAISNHYERAYGISVQGWGSWMGDEAKALGLTVLFGVPVLLLFNWMVRRWRRYWLGIWWSLCRFWSFRC